MCGIFCSISHNGFVSPDPDTLTSLQSRGPDSCQIVQRVIHGKSETPAVYMTFVSTVLALRGEIVQQQPLIDPETGSVLCWNGEAWKIDGIPVTGNDSIEVFRRLLKPTVGESSSHDEDVAKKLAAIAGPFAFVFYDASSSSLFFGRDQLGRRSLIIEDVSDQLLTISSISTYAHATAVEEVRTEGIFALSLQRPSFPAHHIHWPGSRPICNQDIPIYIPPVLPSSVSVESILSTLKQSLHLRVLDIPTHSSLQRSSDAAKVAILFSGGVDCTLLARLAHDLLPVEEPIDLLNVAFENPRAMAAFKNSIASAYDICPDRITGRASYEELSRICGGRIWRFVAIDIPYAEAMQHKSQIVKLMAPHATEMDLSITMALYFAARGRGSAYTMNGLCDETYSTTARVLLSGLGADELFGGYSRHAAAFARGSYRSLIEELQLDFSRIGERNLGRDDRVLSHWGKEIRYPYLDEDFTAEALGLAVWEKCGFRDGRAIPKHYEEAAKASMPEELEPAKLLLRVALWQLGMKSCASERKRAIQFGTKTAKMDLGQGRTKGTDRIDG